MSHDQLSTAPKNNTLGYTLLFSGLIAAISLIIYIVIIQKPPIYIIVATFISWLVFVIGKTMVKTKEIPDTGE